MSIRRVRTLTATWTENDETHSAVYVGGGTEEFIQELKELICSPTWRGGISIAMNFLQTGDYYRDKLGRCVRIE